MGKKSTPAAPDYTAAAEKTADANLEMARYNTNSNRINQQTPWGSLTYTNNQSYDNAAYARAMQDWNASKKKGTMPNQNDFVRDNWTQTETVSPEIQKALDSQIAIQQGLSDQANSMLNTVKNSYAQPFTAKKWDEYTAGMPGVNTSSLGRIGSFSGDGSGIDTSRVGQAGVFGGNGDGINVNAPQFTNARQDEYARAAYDSQMGLLRGDLDNQEQRTNNRLALQGLTPGSEASDRALGSFYDGRSRQLQSLAAQSVLTGNQMSNTDYGSQLAGFGAGNQAQGQKFALDQEGYNTNLNGLTTNAQLQAAYNQAQAQKFALDQEGFNTNANATLNNAQLQAGENAQQQQLYNQLAQTYGMNWQQEQTLRNMPLNELNALLNGQQVQNPTFEGYNMQQYVPGADYSGAAQSQYQAEMDAFNAQSKNRNAGIGAVAGIAGSMFGGPIGGMAAKSLFG